MDAKESILFLSADIAGSTQYKQSVPHWPVVFLEFYWSFAQYLVDAQLEISPQQTKCADGVTFDLWKAVGDELIYEVRVKDEGDISFAVRVWLKAVTLCEKTLAPEGLELKGGAFLATFPDPDNRSTIPRQFGKHASGALGRSELVSQHREALTNPDSDAYLVDYFGPSIDTGFRVFSQATSRYFALSIEVAWAMSVCAKMVQVDGDRQHALDSVSNGSNGSSAPKAKIHTFQDAVYMGGRTLKGVWNGRPYPLIGLDRLFEDDLQLALDQLDATQKEFSSVDVDTVESLGRNLRSDRNWPFRMYLPNSSIPLFKAELGDGPLASATKYVIPTSGYEDPLPDEEENKIEESGGEELTDLLPVK